MKILFGRDVGLNLSVVENSHSYNTFWGDWLEAAYGMACGQEIINRFVKRMVCLDIARLALKYRIRITRY
jgi:hypothetical protein